MAGKKTENSNNSQNSNGKETPRFVGGGWSKDNGDQLSINVEKLLDFVKENPDLKNKYGDVKLWVGNKKEPDEKSKQNLFVVMQDYEQKN